MSSSNVTDNPELTPSKEELFDVLQETADLLNQAFSGIEPLPNEGSADTSKPFEDDPNGSSCNSPDKDPGARHVLEPTASNLEREIVLRGESAEKRSKILQLPSSSIPPISSPREREMNVGDDRAQNKIHVLCECEQPSVAGGAVPMVTSFIAPDTNEAPTKKEQSHKPRPSLIPKLAKTEKLPYLGRSKTGDASKPSRNICFSASASKLKTDKDTTNQDEKTSKSNQEAEKLTRYRRLTSEFTKYVSRLTEGTTNLTNAINSPESQARAVDDLYKHIINLKTVTNELKSLQNTTAASEPRFSPKPRHQEDDGTLKSNSNKIHIKFLPTKMAVIKKNKSCNSEAQTTLEVPNTTTSTKTPTEPKEVDSMDGVFIPSTDSPPDLEEEDEAENDGLDITITFPELQKTLEDKSYLSVCFSNLSADALGRLKRCPKEFTLKMDFTQGKMFFQSARSPANNYSIGPDMKITECSIDTKKSDIISIKPSTECLYASQIIPVEGDSTKESLKLLKSTDSELFSVVSLPHMHRRGSCTTQSCITFRNIRRTSHNSRESLLGDRAYYKSMPQIPSLTRILEEPSMENALSAARHEKKIRNRALQRKRTNTSLEHVL